MLNSGAVFGLCVKGIGLKDPPLIYDRGWIIYEASVRSCGSISSIVLANFNSIRPSPDKISSELLIFSVVGVSIGFFDNTISFDSF